MPTKERLILEAWRYISILKTSVAHFSKWFFIIFQTLCVFRFDFIQIIMKWTQQFVPDATAGAWMSLQWRHNGRNNVSPASPYSTVYSDADQRKHQSSASLAFGNSPVTVEFPAQRASNVIMMRRNLKQSDGQELNHSKQISHGI